MQTDDRPLDLPTYLKNVTRYFFEIPATVTRDYVVFFKNILSIATLPYLPVNLLNQNIVTVYNYFFPSMLNSIIALILYILYEILYLSTYLSQFFQILWKVKTLIFCVCKENGKKQVKMTCIFLFQFLTALFYGIQDNYLCTG